MSGRGRRDEVPNNEILTIEEVAAYLRLTPQTIYKWAQEKRIPAVKLGKEWRFRRSVIDRWFDDQLQGGDAALGSLKGADRTEQRP
jgi:excisionase family DNA binding protein